MSKSLFFALTKAGAPYVGANCAFMVFRTKDGVDRTPPVFTSPGANNLYSFELSDDDEAATTVFAISTDGADVGVLVGAAHPANHPCAVVAVLDAYGVPWTGAAPTLADVEYLDGSPWSAPALTSVESWLFALQPSIADSKLGVQARVVPPAASGTSSISLVFKVESLATANTYPADAVAQLLAGTVAIPSPPGGADVVLSYATNGNIMVGPVRPVEGVMPQLSVFVLQTGGQQPMPYMGGTESWHATRVQVTVRGEFGAFARGEGLARALLARAHLNTPPGYAYCLALDSDPVWIGTDDDNANRWTFNLELGHRR